MLLILVVVMQAITSLSYAADQNMPIALPGCEDECGGVKIPYPFGMGEGCYYNSTKKFGNYSYGIYYKITCNKTTVNPLSFTPIYGTDIPLLNITLDDHSFRINSRVAYECFENNQTTGYHESSLSMVEFTVSTAKNKFVAIGCDTKASISGYRFEEDYLYYTGCMTYCTTLKAIQSNGSCSGVGCCETSVPDGTSGITTKSWSFNNHSEAPFNPCSAAFVVENGAFTFSIDNLTAPQAHFQALRLPTVFDWSIVGDASCDSTHHTLCGLNSMCVDRENDTKGYRCKCKSGYTGNPYLHQGCQDVDECLNPNLNLCEKPSYCVNKEGKFECKCPSGFRGNGTKSDPCKADGWNSWPSAVKVTLGTGIGLIAFLVAGIMFHLYHERKKILDLRRNFFQENGGLVLHKKLRDRNISIQRFRIFTTQELEKATSNFSPNNVVGRGGFGMVYGGTLQDGQQIAIKRSLKVDATQVDQFINETLVLSEINNRNVVKLLGCCLDTEVPLLVYEFISNGTLYEHLHDEAKASVLSWEIRLTIAEAVASVLSYLHTTISIPIIHRDMKTMNILLDENYTAKVSDFGASKLVPMDQDQLATVVLGTHGYLDPEYMQTQELTQKSDVYSFGVVLVELLTRKKAICYDLPDEEKCLAKNFLCKMKEYRLFDIVDRVIMMNENLEQIKEVAELARCCLSVRGEERPTMKEVAMELESIRKMVRHDCENVAGLSVKCDQYLISYDEVEDNEKGNTSSTTGTSIAISRILSMDLEDGR